MWAWVAGIVLGEHVTGLSGAWLGMLLLWPDRRLRKAVFWLLAGLIMGTGVQYVYQSYELPDQAFMFTHNLTFSDCRQWESSRYKGLVGRKCRLSEAPWPAWVGERFDLYCLRCKVDRAPDGRFVARVRLKPRPWWRNQGSYQVPLKWLRPGERVLVQVRSLHFEQAVGFDPPFRPARGYRHEVSIAALTLGQTQGLTPAQWQVLAQSGLMHLLVVSGLHVGALLGVWGWSMQRLRRRLGWSERAWRLPLLAGSTVLLFGYVHLTGAGVPVLRAALTGLAALLIWTFRLWHRPFELLLAVMGGVLLLVPGAPWMPGFWLSFGLTVAILLSLHGRIRVARSVWASVLSLQLRLTLVSGVLLGVLFHQVPVMSLPANLLMIPWMVCVVFPLSASGVLAGWVWPDLSHGVLMLADHAFGVFWRVAEWAASYGTVWLPFSPAWLLILAPWVMFAVMRLRVLAVLFLGLLGMLAVEGARRPPVSLTILDVGQGSAAVIQIGEAFWLIDSGTEYAARKVVVPWLRWQGVERLSLIASHSDNDHAGGMATVLNDFPDAQRWAGQPPDAGWQACRAGTVFYAQAEVRLEALWPDDRLPPGAPDNAHSCVIRLQVGAWQALLPGDLTRRWQYALTAQLPSSQHTLWVVPHHGAANGLNPRLWQALEPDVAIISADRFSPYGHPAPMVSEWLANEGIPVLNTGEHGEIGVLWPSVNGAPVIRTSGRKIP